MQAKRFLSVLAIYGAVSLHAPPLQAQSWARLSPFTDVIFKDKDRIVIEFQRRQYELVSINDLATKKILDSARKQFGGLWKKRLAEDLVELMAGAGKPTGKTVKLVLRDPQTLKTKTVAKAPMTAENRAAVYRAVHARAGDRPGKERPPARPLTRKNMSDVLDAFQKTLEERWSYLEAGKVDIRRAIRSLRGKVAQGITAGEFVIELQKVIGMGVDGHAGVSGVRLPSSGYLPFLVETSGKRFVAFKPDRSALLDPEYPFVAKMDGRKIEEWIKAASVLVPDGSPQYVRRHGLRQLRALQYWRGELGIKQGKTLSIELVARDAKSRKTLSLPVAARFPTYGTWPRSRSRVLDGNVGYLRIRTMDRTALHNIAEWMPKFRGTNGLIVDVRDNGGGSREALRHLFSYLFRKGDRPRVVNCAAYRLHPMHGPNHLSVRFMARVDSKDWTEEERKAIVDFRKTFRTRWQFPKKKFSDWHYMVLNRLDLPGVYNYSKPVVVLMNEKCFSATDIFLAGLKGCRNVMLMGTASGGGSARSQSFRLAGTRIAVRLGSMVSYQTSGKLFDGNGVQPDVPVDPVPEYFIGGRDNALEKALQIINRK